MAKVLGVDLGSRRIGIAVSDATATVASPLTVLQRGRDPHVDHQRIAALVEEENATRVVVGLPLSLSGAVGPAAEAVLAEAEALAGVVTVPVETHDERLTTVTAERALAMGRVRRSRRRAAVDKVAAAVMLQSWLDCHARRGT